MPEQVLDPGVLEELLETVGGDLEFVVELIETYLSDSPTLLAELTGGLAAGDATAIRRAAHTLKSTSATFGATRLAGVCRQIEAAAAADNLGELAPLAEAAAAEYASAAAALRAEGAALAARTGAA